MVEVGPNEYVGYGATYKTKERKRLGVIPFGIYEGFGFERERRSSNLKEIIVNVLRLVYRSYKPLPNLYYGKKPLDLIGKASMHFIMADLTSLPNVKVGDEVEIKASSILAVKEYMPRKFKGKMEEIKNEVYRQRGETEI